MRTLLLAIALVAVSAAPAALADGSLLSNPGFESGDLTGWGYWIPPGGSLQVVSTSPTHDPIEGDAFAFLKTDGPGSYTRVWQTFEASAGATLSGWAFFRTHDAPPYNDNGYVQVRAGDETGPVVATLFYGDVLGVGAQGFTPWTAFEHTFATAGTYTIEARVSNDFDSLLDSMLGIDGVQLEGNTLEVRVDVKPGSEANVVNLRSKGVVPVAVLGSADLDVRDLDVSSLAFGPDGARDTHGHGHYEDVDGDGVLDLILHFRVQETGLSKEDRSATLTGVVRASGAGARAASTPISGTDVISPK